MHEKVTVSRPRIELQRSTIVDKEHHKLHGECQDKGPASIKQDQDIKIVQTPLDHNA
jgi:hypothetical protein